MNTQSITGVINHWINNNTITFPRGTNKLTAQRAAEAIAERENLTITSHAYQDANADYVVRVNIQH